MEAASQLQQIAMISETKQVPFGELGTVSAALQKQVIRDLSPIWSISATVDAFAALEDVPIDYWPIIVRDDIDFPGAAGIHLDKDGHPFALVQQSTGWSLTASHECLEMLCDPLGNRVKVGKSPKPKQGRVEFLVEVCDPSEADEFAYVVNGVDVSTFIRRTISPQLRAPEHVTVLPEPSRKPRQVLKGGYLSWRRSCQRSLVPANLLRRKAGIQGPGRPCSSEWQHTHPDLCEDP